MTHKETRAIGFRLLRVLIILCVISSPALAFSRTRAETPLAATPVNRAPLAVPLLSIEPTRPSLEPLPALSIDASPQNPWFYQGVVQLAYAGIIAWIIALLQKSGK
ncbi:MAG TPA: hypothetical protein V6C57_03545 [Coleofasciculaceae cyanobacterium]